MRVRVSNPFVRNKDTSLKRLAAKAGKLPGSVDYTGSKVEAFRVDHIWYNETELHKTQYDKPADVPKVLEEGYVHWLDVVGLNHTDAVEEFCNQFDIHSLLQEDIVNVEQLPKVDDFETRHFIAMKMISLREDKMAQEHISMVLGKNFVLCFQEKSGDVFNELRRRLDGKIGRIRSRTADYLYSQLIDTVVDCYFSVFEHVREGIEELEFRMLDDQKRDYTNDVIELRKKIIQLRRWVLPLREVLTKLRKSENALINAKWRHYFDDTKDQLEHVLQFFDEFRDMLNYLMDLNFANLTNQTNDIVKTLTVISAIFIPLTFIVGLYGMNFHYMPELEVKNGYFYILGLMLVIFIASIIAMKRRNWW